MELNVLHLHSGFDLKMRGIKATGLILYANFALIGDSNVARKQ